MVHVMNMWINIYHGKENIVAYDMKNESHKLKHTMTDLSRKKALFATTELWSLLVQRSEVMQAFLILQMWKNLECVVRKP